MILFIVLSSILVYFLLGAIAMGITEELLGWRFPTWDIGPERLGWLFFWPIALFFVGLVSAGNGATYLTRQLIRRVRRR